MGMHPLGYLNGKRGCGGTQITNYTERKKGGI